jgi:hypothetical protein
MNPFYNFSYAEIISSLALVAALGSLAWNIVRDFITDKVAIKLSVAFGESGNIKNSATGLFADAGSLLPDHKFDNPSTLVTIVNIGRKPIGISSVGGEFKKGEHFSMSVAGLPKMLQPYEIFSTAFEGKRDFMEKVSKNEVTKLWVIDTACKKWFLSRKGWERLKRTADYISSNKHL